MTLLESQQPFGTNISASFEQPIDDIPNGSQEFEDPLLIDEDEQTAPQDDLDVQSQQYFNFEKTDENHIENHNQEAQNAPASSDAPSEAPAQNAPDGAEPKTPPIPDHLRLLKEREKQSERTRSSFKGIAGSLGLSIAYPPALIGSGVATVHTIMQELRFRQKFDKERGVGERGLKTHLGEMLVDAKDALLGKGYNEETHPFSAQDLESSLLSHSDCLSELSKYNLPEPQSDFTKACFEGDRAYLVKHWDRLREENQKEFDFTLHDYKYALHYAAVAGRAEICKQLINYGADEKVQFEGRTPDQLTTNIIVQDTIRAFSILRRELDVLIGMEKIKRNIYQMTNKIILDKRRAMVAQRNGTRVVQNIPRRHMSIQGNPGTGKTKVAALIAHLYFALGIIKKNVFITAQRADLCGMYVGQTAPRTRKMIEKAAGGVLFVDEAYRLSQSDDPGKDYGQEAIDEIMQHMTDESSNRTIFIFAGYKKPMQRFIQSNPGIFRRVDFKLDFDDYSCRELADITVLNVKLAGYKLAPNVDAEIIEQMIVKHTTNDIRSQMNGGLSEKLVQYAIQVQSEMLSLDASDEELSILNKAHLEVAIKLIMVGGDIHSLEKELIDEAEEVYNNMDESEKKKIEELAEKINTLKSAQSADTAPVAEGAGTPAKPKSPTTPQFDEEPSVFDTVTEEARAEAYKDLIDDLLD